MQRVKWKCPGCKKVLFVPDVTDLVLCADCRVDPEIKSNRKEVSGWTTSDISFVVIAASLFICFSVILANVFWKAVPKSDPEKVLVEKWLKENLEDGRWEEVKWFPAQTLQGLYDANLLHIIENMEKEKNLYEKGLGDAEIKAVCQQCYEKLRETGVRTFCAMKFRVTSLNGEIKVLRRQVFEIADGQAKARGDNDIVELPSAPLKRPSLQSGPPVYQAGVSYDGWRFFEDPEYNPFPADPSRNLEDRLTAAMIWKEPVKVATPTPVEPQRQQMQPQGLPAAVNVPANRPNSEVKTPEMIPLKIKEYFDRAVEVKSAEIKVLEQRITNFKSKLRTAPVNQKTLINERIRQTEEAVAELKRSNGNGYLPDKPDVGDVGMFLLIEVTEVVDDETLLIRWLPNGKGQLPRTDVVIYPIETAGIKKGDATINSEFFKITATKSEPSDMLKDLTNAGKKVDVVAEPIEKNEIEKWRAQYEKEYKKR